MCNKTIVITVPSTIESRSDKNDLLFATLDFLEQNIIIKKNGKRKSICKRFLLQKKRKRT